MPDDEKPNLQTSLDKICWIVLKAHEFDAKDMAADEDPGSNPSDDKMVDVLEEHSDDPVRQEMATFIDSADPGSLDTSCLEQLMHTPVFTGSYGWEP